MYGDESLNLSKRPDWGVLMQSTDGKTQQLALNGNSGPALFARRKDADAFMRELKEHIESPMKLVQVWCSIDVRAAF